MILCFLRKQLKNECATIRPFGNTGTRLLLIGETILRIQRKNGIC